MTRKFIGGLALLSLVACGGKKDQTQAAADSLQRDLQLAPAESTTAINDQPTPQAETPAPAPAPTTPAPTPAPKPKPTPSKPAAPKTHTYTLATGSEVTGSADDSLHSRHNKVGELFHATVGADVKDAAGATVIPAGAVVTFKVTRLNHANNKSEKDGKLTLEAQEVSIAGQSYPISGSATETTVEHALEGQGVTAGAAARVGGGAVGGAILGKVIGGKTGAIIGGAAGAAGGAVAASHTADRDVVVRPGMKVTFTLGGDFSITR
jgi:type IV secretory pathway VirB10-like protein